MLFKLKYSGSLRYFKNQRIQRLVVDLSSAILYIKDRQDLETTVRVQFINPFTIAHYDYDFDAGITKGGVLPFAEAVNQYEKSNEIIPFRLRHADNIDRAATINMLGFIGMSGIRPTRQQHFQRYRDLNAELLRELRKQYHLK